MNQSTLCTILACIGVIFYLLIRPYIHEFSQAAVCAVLICLVVACFIVGKICPEFFTPAKNIDSFSQSIQFEIERIKLKKFLFQLLKKLSQLGLILWFLMSVYISLPKNDETEWHFSYFILSMIYPSVVLGLIMLLSNKVIKRMNQKLRDAIKL